MSKKAIVVGAGIGGIATALLLSKKGFQVEIFEKNAYAGGRCSGFVKEGHRFDAGATMLMMPDAFELFYQLIGKSFRQELELIRMDPAYRVYFENQTKLDFTADLVKLRPQLDTFEKGGYKKFLRYMAKSSRAFEMAIERFINKNYYTIFDMFNPGNLAMLYKTKVYRSYYGAVKSFFKSPVLQHVFTLQSLYLGLNPAKSPGVFYSLPEMELSQGVWFPKGGMKQVAENLLSIARENNILIHLKSAVEKINTESKFVKGISLEDGSFHEADIIVVNADLPYTYHNLLPDNTYKNKLDSMEYTCSSLVFHWGIDTVFPQLDQHNVFISSDHKSFLKAVFENGTFPVNPTFYLHAPAKNDATAAPQGQESITVIVPIPNLDNKTTNWEELKTTIRSGIIARLSAEGISDFDDHIKFEEVFTPPVWKSLFNFSKGSTFGSLSHSLFQMGYFRPHNRHKKYKNLFFVGAGTHPGNGVPMTMISAKLVAERINESIKS